jgi:hypothetical protein
LNLAFPEAGKEGVNDRNILLNPTSANPSGEAGSFLLGYGGF